VIDLSVLDAAFKFFVQRPGFMTVMVSVPENSIIDKAFCSEFKASTVFAEHPYNTTHRERG
jgi:hypothetical protein